MKSVAMQSPRRRAIDVTAKTGDAMRYLRRNPSLAIGIGLLLFLVLFSVVGALTYGTDKSRALSVPAGLAPCATNPLGTDLNGRDMLATMIAAIPLTFRVGFIAGFLGLFIGTLLGFVSAYYGGVVDFSIKGIVDIMLTVPQLLVLIIVAVTIKENLTVDQMALIVASLAWLQPARTIRSQVLTLRERPYIELARLSGMTGREIIVREIMPNLLPYLGALLVVSVAAGILASIGLEALGLGPMEAPTLGMTIYWAMFHAALLLGMWWWFVPAIVIIVLLFLGLYSLSRGLDEIANPRLRRSV